MVLGDKTVFSTLPWLSFYKCEGNKEQDKVIHGLQSVMWKCEVSAQEAAPAPCHGCTMLFLWSQEGIAAFGIGEETALVFKSCFFLFSAGASWSWLGHGDPLGSQDKYPHTEQSPRYGQRAWNLPRDWIPWVSQSCRGEQQSAVVKSPKVQKHCRCQHLVFL